MDDCGIATKTTGVKYITEKELASRFSLSVKWCQSKRLSGGGVPYHKFGQSVRYALEDVIEYERASARRHT